MAATSSRHPSYGYRIISRKERQAFMDEERRKWEERQRRKHVVGQRFEGLHEPGVGVADWEETTYHDSGTTVRREDKSKRHRKNLSAANLWKKGAKNVIGALRSLGMKAQDEDVPDSPVVARTVVDENAPKKGSFTVTIVNGQGLPFERERELGKTYCVVSFEQTSRISKPARVKLGRMGLDDDTLQAEATYSHEWSQKMGPFNATDAAWQRFSVEVYHDRQLPEGGSERVNCGSAQVRLGIKKPDGSRYFAAYKQKIVVELKKVRDDDDVDQRKVKRRSAGDNEGDKSATLMLQIHYVPDDDVGASDDDESESAESNPDMTDEDFDEDDEAGAGTRLGALAKLKGASATSILSGENGGDGGEDTDNEYLEHSVMSQPDSDEGAGGDGDESEPSEDDLQYDADHGDDVYAVDEDGYFRETGVQGNIHIMLIKAKNLLKADVIGQSDPYCVFTLSHDYYKRQKVKSKVKKKTLNPIWNQHMPPIEVMDFKNQDLVCEVYDEDIASDDFLGMFELPLNDPKLRLLSGEAKTITVPLRRGRGTVTIEIAFQRVDREDKVFARLDTLDSGSRQGFRRVDSGLSSGSRGSRGSRGSGKKGSKKGGKKGSKKKDEEFDEKSFGRVDSRLSQESFGSEASGATTATQRELDKNPPSHVYTKIEGGVNLGDVDTDVVVAAILDGREVSTPAVPGGDTLDWRPRSSPASDRLLGDLGRIRITNWRKAKMRFEARRQGDGQVLGHATVPLRNRKIGLSSMTPKRITLSLKNSPGKITLELSLTPFTAFHKLQDEGKAPDDMSAFAFDAKDPAGRGKPIHEEDDELYGADAADDERDAEEEPLGDVHGGLYVTLVKASLGKDQPLPKLAKCTFRITPSRASDFKAESTVSSVDKGSGVVEWDSEVVSPDMEDLDRALRVRNFHSQKLQIGLVDHGSHRQIGRKEVRQDHKAIKLLDGKLRNVELPLHPKGVGTVHVRLRFKQKTAVPDRNVVDKAREILDDKLAQAEVAEKKKDKKAVFDKDDDDDDEDGRISTENTPRLEELEQKKQPKKKKKKPKTANDDDGDGVAELQRSATDVSSYNQKMEEARAAMQEAAARRSQGGGAGPLGRLVVKVKRAEKLRAQDEDGLLLEEMGGQEEAFCRIRLGNEMEVSRRIKVTPSKPVPEWQETLPPLEVQSMDDQLRLKVVHKGPETRNSVIGILEFKLKAKSLAALLSSPGQPVAVAVPLKHPKTKEKLESGVALALTFVDAASEAPPERVASAPLDQVPQLSFEGVRTEPSVSRSQAAMDSAKESVGSDDAFQFDVPDEYEGTLHITLVRGEGIRNKQVELDETVNLFNARSYVTLQLGEQEIKSDTVDAHGARTDKGVIFTPVWDERMRPLYVERFDSDKLHITVHDSNDAVLGFVTVKLRSKNLDLLAGKTKTATIPLKEGNGSVKLKLRYREGLLEEEEDDDDDVTAVRHKRVDSDSSAQGGHLRWASVDQFDDEKSLSRGHQSSRSVSLSEGGGSVKTDGRKVISSDVPIQGTLAVKLYNLVFPKSCPVYVTCSMEDSPWPEVIENSVMDIDPADDTAEWNKKIGKLHVADYEEQTLHIQVMQKRKLRKDKLLGFADVGIEALQDGGTGEIQVPLDDPQNPDGTRGEINLDVTLRLRH